MAKLRINEAQVLFEALRDQTFRLGLQVFCTSQHDAIAEDLIRQIRLKERDTMKEAQLAGKLEVYESVLLDLDHFAQKSLRDATQ